MKTVQIQFTEEQIFDQKRKEAMSCPLRTKEVKKHHNKKRYGKIVTNVFPLYRQKNIHKSAYKNESVVLSNWVERKWYPVKDLVQTLVFMDLKGYFNSFFSKAR